MAATDAGTAGCERLFTRASDFTRAAAMRSRRAFAESAAIMTGVSQGVVRRQSTKSGVPKSMCRQSGGRCAPALTWLSPPTDAIAARSSRFSFETTLVEVDA